MFWNRNYSKMEYSKIEYFRIAYFYFWCGSFPHKNKFTETELVKVAKSKQVERSFPPKDCVMSLAPLYTFADTNKRTLGQCESQMPLTDAAGCGSRRKDRHDNVKRTVTDVYRLMFLFRRDSSFLLRLVQSLSAHQLSCLNRKIMFIIFL